MSVATIEDVRAAEPIIRRHFSPAPLIRSYPLEKELGLAPGRRFWIKDYGWTPVGSFKLMGALNWMANNVDRVGSRPVAANSSGNFAAGLAFAGKCYEKKVIIVMPDTAPQVKFDRTRSLGAEIRTYEIAMDHETGQREKLTRQIAEEENGVQASPYDDNLVIAGNGVGGLEIAHALQAHDRDLSTFICAVSGGGLMAGHMLAISDAFPAAKQVGVEPDGANDFQQSIAAGERVRIDRPNSICDGLCSYDVGQHNWPILRNVDAAVTVPDAQTCEAMKWLYQHHGLRAEPSGVVTIAAALCGQVDLSGEGDVVAVVSGRNVDEDRFRVWTDS